MDTSTVAPSSVVPLIDAGKTLVGDVILSMVMVVAVSNVNARKETGFVLVVHADLERGTFVGLGQSPINEVVAERHVRRETGACNLTPGGSMRSRDQSDYD